MARPQNLPEGMHAGWLAIFGVYALYVGVVLSTFGGTPVIVAFGIGVAVFAIGILALKLRSIRAPRRTETIQMEEAPLWFGLNGPFGV